MKHLYNSKITVQEVARTKDGSGTWTETWSDVTGLADIPCRINWLTGSISRGETMVGGKVEWIRDGKVYLDYYPTITTEMRIVYNSTNYNIVNLANVDEKDQYMVLNIKKVVG